MRTIAFVLLAACGAAPDKPLLANVPQPPTGAMAGAAAAAAAAITLADPDAATRGPEKKEDVEKKPVNVKENVPGDVFDRLDTPHSEPVPDATPAAAPQPSKQPAGKPAKKPDLKLPPRDPLDFSQP